MTPVHKENARTSQTTNKIISFAITKEDTSVILSDTLLSKIFVNYVTEGLPGHRGIPGFLF